MGLERKVAVSKNAISLWPTVKWFPFLMSSLPTALMQTCRRILPSGVNEGPTKDT